LASGGKDALEVFKAVTAVTADNEREAHHFGMDDLNKIQPWQDKLGLSKVEEF
jgi:hypothetical protein